MAPSSTAAQDAGTDAAAGAGTDADAGTDAGGPRRIVLEGAGVRLSALLAEPVDGAPRAAVVALHGSGMNAAYFHARADPRLSLLTLGPRLGYTVLALDRPGYGRSASAVPDGQRLAEQTRTVRAALADFAARHGTGAGLFLLAHSFGGKVALTAAADDGVPGLLGLDVSGCGHEYAVPPGAVSDLDGPERRRRNWGPLRLYPPGTFVAGGAFVATVPAREFADLEDWPRVLDTAAPRIRVPVRFTFAEHEGWWRHDDTRLRSLRTRFTAAPRVVVERRADAGHNISLGWAARAYHLSALAFLEECLVRAEAAPPGTRVS
ncbi:alpha/beta fold hydrolase [Streptomyces antibioticus]|uniref:alpha/beta fold hydrolase n=1 Tax=Streptomyces antibioticus TaxID=1890 RepID=UPI00339DFE7F